MLDVTLAIGHHLLIFSLFGILVGELLLVGPAIDAIDIQRVARIDLGYGVIATLILILGFSRAIFAATTSPTIVAALNSGHSLLC